MIAENAFFSLRGEKKAFFAKGRKIGGLEIMHEYEIKNALIIDGTGSIHVRNGLIALSSDSAEKGVAVIDAGWNIG